MSDYQRREDRIFSGSLFRRGAFLAFNHSVEREDGVIPRKYRELIALGVAFTTSAPTASIPIPNTPVPMARAGRRSRKSRSLRPPSTPAVRWHIRCWRCGFSPSI